MLFSPSKMPIWPLALAWGVIGVVLFLIVPPRFELAGLALGGVGLLSHLSWRHVEPKKTVKKPTTTPPGTRDE